MSQSYRNFKQYCKMCDKIEKITIIDGENQKQHLERHLIRLHILEPKASKAIDKFYDNYPDHYDSEDSSSDEGNTDTDKS